MPRYYLRNNTPVETWAEIPVEDLSKPVADTFISNEVNVSTVFTGYNLGTDDEPKIFETLVHGGYYDGTRSTYFNEAEALKGHEYWVEKASVELPEGVNRLADIILEIGETNAYKLAQQLIEKGIIKLDE